MTDTINETHGPHLRSWVESANTPEGDFPIQNLPFGVFRRRGKNESPRVGVAIGDQILDISAGVREGLFNGASGEAANACVSDSLDALMALGPRLWSALRKRVSEILRTNSRDYERNPALAARILVPMAEAELLLPAVIGDYTDFYASIHHATNVGSMIRPENPLLPNYKHIPIGYHGRSSSIVVSGTQVRRPNGQMLQEQSETPRFGPCKLLDYELEIGFFVGQGNTLGEPIPIAKAGNHIFGFCIVNDWSARDMQKWEYQPLGPFLGKNFATTVSSWVVTLEALAPFRVPMFARSEQDPKPLPYLTSHDDQQNGAIDITLEVYLSTQKMRDRGIHPGRLSRGNFREMYWTVAQMLTHHTSNGCNLRPGDLMASGTVSGAANDSYGCMLELTWRGTKPVQLSNGEIRRFLEDGDEVTMRGFCEREGYMRIGFGECRGVVLPALAS